MEIKFEAGKKPRNELRLPTLHFIVADDWIDKLGMEAFRAWLKFHTWVDRRDANRPYDKVPYTLEQVAEKLGMSRTKLYKKVIRPLWNYYLIDLIEYTEDNRKTQKPLNIIVYESPMNSYELAVQPLKQLRDYDKDYASPSQIFGRQGGRPIKLKEEPQKEDLPDQQQSEQQSEQQPEPQEPAQEGGQNKDPNRFNFETVGDDHSNRFKNETVDRFKNETVTVSESKHNNDTNKLTNETNNSTNRTNNQQQQQEADQVVVVVVEVQQTIEKLFGVKLPEEQIKMLIEHAKEKNRNLMNMIQNTYDFFATTGEECTNPFGAIHHAIKNNGWFIPRKSDKPANPNPKEDKYAGLPKAVRMQLEAEKNGQEYQSTLSEEELAERRKRIQEKIRYMEEIHAQKQREKAEMMS